MSSNPTYGYYPRAYINYPMTDISSVSISYRGNVNTTNYSYTGQTSGSFTSGDLSFNNLYTFSIVPYNSSNMAGPLHTVTINTTPSITGNYSATYSNITSFKLYWNGIYDYVKVSRAFDIGNVISTGVVSTDTDLSMTVYNMPFIDNDLSGNTTYKYTVTPYIGGGYNSAAYSVTYYATPQCAYNLIAGLVDTSSIQVYFNYPKNSYTDSVSYTLSTTDNSIGKSGLSSPLQLTGLTDDTSYNLVVYTYNNLSLLSTSMILKTKTPKLLTITGTGTYTKITITGYSTAYKFTDGFCNINFGTNITINAFIVGGGGGGGYGKWSEGGGGGGGGGVGTGTINVNSNTNYTITVGNGGVGNNLTSYTTRTGAYNACNGKNSSIVGPNISETAYGGGHGQGMVGSSINATSNAYAEDGGSGGGGSNGWNNGNAGTGLKGLSSSTSGYASMTYYGNSGIRTSSISSGGGGGAGGAAIDSSGGLGYTFNSSSYGGGGGSGGNSSTNYGKGYGGGGNGGSNTNNGVSATVNSGGGGGGAGANGGVNGGNGGKGVIFLYW